MLKGVSWNFGSPTRRALATKNSDVTSYAGTRAHQVLRVAETLIPFVDRAADDCISRFGAEELAAYRCVNLRDGLATDSRSSLQKMNYTDFDDLSSGLCPRSWKP
ncbi:hypothetical protein GCM10027344_16070 [Spelaeicoccus albus]